MKQTYLLALLFFSSLLSAQNVNIPDANFKNRLLNANPSYGIAYSNGVAVQIDLNNDNEIQASEAVLIDSLNLGDVGILNLTGINDFVNLKKLDCRWNALTTLDVSGLTLLQKLNADDNQLSIVDLSSNTQLLEVSLTSNQLNSINVDNLLLLEKLYLSANNLSIIDVTTLVALQRLRIGNNSLSTLDCSQNVNLKFLSIAVNPLITVFIKNGSDESELIDSGGWMENWMYGNTPLLEYICADENQVASIQNLTGTGVVVNSYCNFNPGGDFNTISGTTRMDLEGNGCDVNDLTAPFISFGVAKDGVNSNSNVYTNSLGDYAFYASQTGNYTLTPNLENLNYYIVSPNPASVTVSEIDNSTTFQDFCLTVNGVQPDLEVVTIPVLTAMPGFDALYKIVYKNKGNQTVNGTVSFDFNDAFMDFVSAIPLPSSEANGQYGFNFTNLVPFETRTVLVRLNINTPTEANPVNNGDILEFIANVTLTSASMIDVNYSDNTFTLNQTVVGSFDPNDITCLQGNFLPVNDIGSYLHYNIRFENTGTAAAQNIVVKNTINLSQYDIQSLRVLESSHPVAIKVAGDVAEFIFEGINLDPEVQGNVLYKIKTKATLANNEVKNKAEIYFDYNFPIITNDELTVFSTLSNSDFSKDSSLQIYPNPVQDILNIKSANLITSIQLNDSQGRLLTTKVANETSEVLDISKYSAGIYFVTVVTSVGKQTQKIIKK